MSANTTEVTVTANNAPCGAVVRGVDLTHALSREQVDAIRDAWLAHQLLVLPTPAPGGQELQLEDLERFASTIGPFGVDPYFGAVPGHPHVAQVKRAADEKTRIFAEAWHSDWSFLVSPPQATLLYGNVIPPVGGDTLFANQYMAWDALPEVLKRQVANRMGVHSARRGYSPQGAYGESDTGRSMDIRYSETAMATQLHPIARVHPETGRTALYVSPGYTIGIDGMPDDEAQVLLGQLFLHQAQPEFVYRHSWSQGMLLMWDNRCLVHAATGGYDGHARLLHRITLAERVN